MAARMDKIAQGAALMTETTFEKKVLTGCNETRIVPALVKIMNDVMAEEVPSISWTEEEKKFSRNLLQNLGVDRRSLRADVGSDVWENPLDEG